MSMTSLTSSLSLFSVDLVLFFPFVTYYVTIFQADRTQREKSLANGLFKGHAYSITAVTEVRSIIQGGPGKTS